jgi:hypothetical protein
MAVLDYYSLDLVPQLKIVLSCFLQCSGSSSSIYFSFHTGPVIYI